MDLSGVYMSFGDKGYRPGTARPVETLNMPRQAYQVKKLRPMSLSLENDSPPVVFGAFCAILASIFYMELTGKVEYLALLGISRLLPESGSDCATGYRSRCR